jgi:diguanylate cyclase (GGDEF)-like protein
MSLRAKISVIVAVPIVVLLAAMLALAVSRQRTNQSLAAERYSVALNDGYERVDSDLIQAQLGMHGYLLTGQSRFLVPYELATERLPGDMLSLTELTRGDASEEQEVAKLQNLIGQQIPSLEELRAFAPITDMRDAGAVIDVLVDGDVVTSQIREISETVRADSTNASIERRKHLDASRDVFFAIAMVGLPVGVLASLLLVMVFVGHLAGRIVRTKELARMLDEGMPFRQPSTSDDELGELERALVRSGTRVVELQGDLRRMGTSDQLTRLMNRRGFLPSAEHQLEVAKRTHQPMALMFLDLDGLKQVNDSLGHSAGDGMITEAAFVLRETFRTSDLLGRMGGDEFCVLFAAESADAAVAVLVRLQETIDKVNGDDQRPFILSFSAGVAMFDPELACTVDQLIAVADQRMYEAKREKSKGSDEHPTHTPYPGDPPRVLSR